MLNGFGNMSFQKKRSAAVLGDMDFGLFREFVGAYNIEVGLNWIIACDNHMGDCGIM